MALKRIEPGKRMSSAVIHGNKVYLAGFTPDKALGKSVAEQTRDVLTQIDATLAEARRRSARPLGVVVVDAGGHVVVAAREDGAAFLRIDIATAKAAARARAGPSPCCGPPAPSPACRTST